MTVYYLFGGGVDDYARAYGSDTLLPNAVLTITDPATNAGITDLRDASGTAVTSVSTDAHGEFKFQAPLPVVNVQAAGGSTYQVISKSALVAATDTGSLAAQVTAAQAAASAAAASAGAAATAAANAIPIGQRGTPLGVALLDEAGRLVTTMQSQDTQDRLDQLEADVNGLSDSGGDHQIFQFSTTASPPSLVAGVPGGEWVSPSVPTVLDFVYMALDDYSHTVPSTFDVQINKPPYSGYVSMFPGGLPTVPIDTLNAFGLSAPDPAVPAKSLLRVVPTVVAPASSPSGTPAALKGTQGTYNTGTGTASTHPLTLPSGGATGDTVLVACATAGSVTATMPAGWTKILDQVDNGGGGTARSHLVIWLAPWSGALVPTITTSSGTNLSGMIRLISGADPSLAVAIGKADYQPGASDTGPSGAAPVDCDLILEFAAQDLANPATTGFSTAETGTPTGWAEDYDNATTRATIRNVGLVAGHANGVTSGTTVGAITYTITATGSLSSVSWSLGRVFIVRGAGTHGPTRARVQLNLV